MGGSRMATNRRLQSPLLPKYRAFFSGDGIDIGCGRFGIDRFVDRFPNIKSIRNWDMPDGDAMLMKGVKDGVFDFVHSSHSLEHMRDPRVALGNWIRILKKGGYVIVTIPDWEMYEQLQWPSRFNPDHKFAFTLDPKRAFDGTHVVLVQELLMDVCALHPAAVVHMERCGHGFQPGLRVDQTLRGVECSIEFILKKI